MDSHESCPYCGKTKKDYIDPDTERLSPLKCECEKRFDSFTNAKEGIIQSQFNIRAKVKHNDSKLSADDKHYIVNSEDSLDKINKSISNMLNVKNRRAWENRAGQ